MKQEEKEGEREDKIEELKVKDKVELKVKEELEEKVE